MNIKILVVGVHLRGGVEWRNDDLIEYEQIKRACKNKK